MKANTIMALKKIIKETVEKEVAKQIQIVIKGSKKNHNNSKYIF